MPNRMKPTIRALGAVGLLLAVTACVDTIGQVDVLFNCAGVVHGGSILEMKDSDLDFAIDLNVKAMIRTIRAVLPGMIERKDGAIIAFRASAEEDLTKTRADLAARFGVQAPKAPAMQPWGLRVAYVVDPSGVLWHFAQRGDG